jgi:hypothetical protein
MLHASKQAEACPPYRTQLATAVISCCAFCQTSTMGRQDASLLLRLRHATAAAATSSCAVCHAALCIPQHIQHHSLIDVIDVSTTSHSSSHVQDSSDAVNSTHVELMT